MNSGNPFPVIPVLVLCALVPILVLSIVYQVRRMRRAWKADHVGSCTCGYPIAGLKTDRCPECGKVHEALSQRIVRQRSEMVGFLFASALLLWMASRMTISIATWLVPPVLISPQVLSLGSSLGTIEMRWDVAFVDRSVRTDKVTITRTPIPGTSQASSAPVTVTIVANDRVKADDAQGASSLGDLLAPILNSTAELSSDDRLTVGVELVGITRLACAGRNAGPLADTCRRGKAFSSVQSLHPPFRRESTFPNWTIYALAGLAWAEIARRAWRRFWINGDKPEAADEGKPRASET